MAKPDTSLKRVAISKANAQMVAIVAIASFVAVFSLVASKAVFSQISYQSRVTSGKETAHQQLTKNIDAFNSLVTSYKAFDDASSNSIGGNKDGTGDNDGSNSKIILDALPSSYDFPALTSSIEKILADNNLQVSEISGVDDQLNQQGNLVSPTPKPVQIPFSFSVKNASYDSIQKLIAVLQKSVRPIQIDKLDLNGGANDMTANIEAHTFYQPSKSVNITKKVVK